MMRIAIAIAALLVVPQPADAQIRDRAREAARQALERAAQQARSQAAALPAQLSDRDLLERAVRCEYDHAPCLADAVTADQPVILTDRAGEVITDADGRPIADPADLSRDQRFALLRQTPAALRGGGPPPILLAPRSPEERRTDRGRPR